MTADEFLALKEGDRIVGMNGTHGTVTDILRDPRRHDKIGVSVTWDGTAPSAARAFTKYTTAWMHWTREEPDS